MEKGLFAVGRRKTSVARVKITKGKGSLKINKQDLNQYFVRPSHQILVRKPLELTDTMNNYDILVNVKGGGLSGQAGAVRHAISRALCLVDATNRGTLKKNGFLTRDPRMVERKKYGHKGARKSFQFSKR